MRRDRLPEQGRDGGKGGLSADGPHFARDYAEGMRTQRLPADSPRHSADLRPADVKRGNISRAFTFIAEFTMLNCIGRRYFPGEGGNAKEVVMKNKHLFGLLCFFPVLAVLFGCVTRVSYIPALPPGPSPGEGYLLPGVFRPFTVSLWERLNEVDDDAIERLDIVLSGRIVLENVSTEPRNVWRDREIPDIGVFHITERIVFEDQTEGHGLGMERRGGEIVLLIGFDRESSVPLHLPFSASAADPDSYFYFIYHADYYDSVTDTRGTIEYGGNDYRVSYTGELPPHLLIRLIQRDTERPTTRIAPGRPRRTRN